MPSRGTRWTAPLVPPWRAVPGFDPVPAAQFEELDSISWVRTNSVKISTFQICRCKSAGVPGSSPAVPLRQPRRPVACLAPPSSETAAHLLPYFSECFSVRAEHLASGYPARSTQPFQIPMPRGRAQLLFGQNYRHFEPPLHRHTNGPRAGSVHQCFASGSSSGDGRVLQPLPGLHPSLLCSVTASYAAAPTLKSSPAIECNCVKRRLELADCRRVDRHPLGTNHMGGSSRGSVHRLRRTGFLSRTPSAEGNRLSCQVRHAAAASECGDASDSASRALAATCSELPRQRRCGFVDHATSPIRGGQADHEPLTVAPGPPGTTIPSGAP